MSAGNNIKAGECLRPHNGNLHLPNGNGTAQPQEAEERRGYRRTHQEIEDFMNKRQRGNLSNQPAFPPRDDDFFRRRGSDDGEDPMSRLMFVPRSRGNGAGTEPSHHQAADLRKPVVKHMSPLNRLHLPASLTITAASSGDNGAVSRPFPASSTLASSSLKDSVFHSLQSDRSTESDVITISPTKRTVNHPDVRTFGAYARSAPFGSVPFPDHPVFQDRNNVVVRPMSPSLSSAERELLEGEDLIVERIEDSNGGGRRHITSPAMPHVSAAAIAAVASAAAMAAAAAAGRAPHIHPMAPPPPMSMPPSPPPPILRNTHSDALMKSCDFCPQRFEFETELSDHVNRFHQGVKKYFCFLCHKRFKRKQSLENHINMIHSGNKA